MPNLIVALLARYVRRAAILCQFGGKFKGVVWRRRLSRMIVFWRDSRNTGAEKKGGRGFVPVRRSGNLEGEAQGQLNLPRIGNGARRAIAGVGRALIARRSRCRTTCIRAPVGAKIRRAVYGVKESDVD